MSSTHNIIVVNAEFGNTIMLEHTKRMALIYLKDAEFDCLVARLEKGTEFSLFKQICDLITSRH